MADNPLPPLRPNATQPEIVDWLNKLVRPRITKPQALRWEQINTAGGSLNDLDGGDYITYDYFQSNVSVATATFFFDQSATTSTRGTVLQAAAETDLSLTTVTPGGAYVQAEAAAVANQVKATGDKVDALMAAMRSAGLLET